MPFASIPRYWSSPVTIASNRDPSRRRAAMRRGESSARFGMRARVSLPPAHSSTSPISTCRRQGGATVKPLIGSAPPRELRVREAFLQEQQQLLPLPPTAFITDDVVAVKIGKTPYARFDLNDYSVPHLHVQRMVTVRANLERVRILDGAARIADHPRSYDRGAQIEDPAHIQQLVAYKRRAREHRGANRLTLAVPASNELLMRAAARGSALGAITMGLLRLLDRYGATETQAAIEETLKSGAPHPHSVRVVLERRREARHQPPPVAIVFPDYLRAKDTAVQPQRLDRYDALTEADYDNDF